MNTLYLSLSSNYLIYFKQSGKDGVRDLLQDVWGEVPVKVSRYVVVFL